MIVNPSAPRGRRGSRRIRFATACVVLLSFTFGVSSPGVAQAPDIPVPPGIQFALLTKILGFDRNLPDRHPGDLVIAVAYQSQHVASRTLMEAFRAAAEEAGAIEIMGRRVRVVAIDIGGGDRLVENLASESADVVYLTPLRGVNVRELARAATRAGILSVTGVPDYMLRAVCVGFDDRGGRPRILINRDESLAAGTAFAAQLLQRAEIVHE
jgi:ABC-type sugar transport system substrate-binding protein